LRAEWLISAAPILGSVIIGCFNVACWLYADITLISYLLNYTQLSRVITLCSDVVDCLMYSVIKLSFLSP